MKIAKECLHQLAYYISLDVDKSYFEVNNSNVEAFKTFLYSELCEKVNLASDNKSTYVDELGVAEIINDAFKFVGVDTDELPVSDNACRIIRKHYTIGYYGVAQKLHGRWIVIIPNPVYRVMDNKDKMQAQFVTKLKACKMLLWGTNALKYDGDVRAIFGVSPYTNQSKSEYSYIKVVNACTKDKCDIFGPREAFEYYSKHYNDTPDMEVIA